MTKCRILAGLFLVLINLNAAHAIKAKDLVNLIIQKTGNTPFKNTVDVFKAGNPDEEVTGVAVCMFATIDVLKQAVETKCNFIITHEPIYYNHLDATDQFIKDAVVAEKQKYINDHHLIIWRFHDYWHTIKPDGVLVGMAEKFGWKQYATNNFLNRFTIPETTLQELIVQLKVKFPGVSFNVVGKPALKVSRVAFSPGASGSNSHIYLLGDSTVDVVLAGESPQWETYEYVRDAVALGKSKAVIFLGHIPSEDAGMEYCTTWLKTFFNEAPVTFLECGPSYITY